MNKKYLFLVCVLILSLLLPSVVMKIQDAHILSYTVPIEDTQTQEILKTHPIITSLYQKYYGLEEETSVKHQYLLDNMETYTKEETIMIKDIQELYSNEINQLIKQQIVTAELLECNSGENYEVSFGTLTIHENREVNLDQIYRMWENNDFKNIVFNLDPKTNKIIEIKVSQQKKISCSEKQLQEIAFQMIKYLELDDINDWTYHQGGYESNKAKLRVDAGIEDYGETYAFHAGVRLLGMSDSYYIKNYNYY